MIYAGERAFDLSVGVWEDMFMNFSWQHRGLVER